MKQVRKLMMIIMLIRKIGNDYDQWRRSLGLFKVATIMRYHFLSAES